MAHWAELDENNIVLRITVGDNNDPNGDEGYQWLIDNLGGRWVKTSYNTNAGEHKLNGIPFRKNYAAIGYFYDQERDAFIPPKIFTSWVLNEETCHYEAPIPFPKDGKNYHWNEEDLKWAEIPVSE